MQAVIRLGRRLYKVTRGAVQAWGDDHAERLAAALSFYAIFSLVPSLIIVIGLTGLVVDQSRVESEIVLQIQRLMGEDAGEYVKQVLENRTQLNGDSNRFVTGLGLATIFFGASGAFAQLQSALNTIWQVRSKPKQGVINFVRRRLFSYVILLLIGFMLMLALVVNTWLVLVNGWLVNVMPGIHLLFNVGNVIFSFAAAMLLFALLYKVMPDVTIRWHDVWAGAVVASLLFNLGKWGIGLYLGNVTLARTFGAGGALVALLIWVYVTSQVILFGAEFIKVFATQRGRAVLPAPHAINVSWTPEDASLTD